MKKHFSRTEHHPFKTCDNPLCPVCTKSIARFKIKEKLNESFFGDSPAPFVGHVGYPNLNVGILSVPETRPDSWMFDAPRFWASSDFQIPQIVDFRSALINSRFKANIKQVNKLVNITQEVGMASKPVEVEVLLRDKPRFRLNVDAYSAPTGPNAALKRVEVTSNPKISQKVDKVVADYDLKANDAIMYLYEHGFDENFLTRMLSVGTVGIKANRKLVPTKWSITAVDDSLGKKLIKEIKDYSVADYLAFFSGYLGNYYLIMFFPDVWSYELFESALGKEYNTDYEGYEGRKTYAYNCAGGYYASRAPVLEKLMELKRQASVLVLRFITSEYTVPLGVWVCRQAARKALQNKPSEFASKELMLKYAEALVKKKFSFDAGYLLKNSKLLNEINKQRKLFAF
jgi:hypothetical protein